MKKCEIINQINPNFTYFFHSISSRLYVDNFILQNNTFLNNVWIRTTKTENFLINITCFDNTVHSIYEGFIFIDDVINNDLNQGFSILNELKILRNYINTSFFKTNGTTSLILNNSLVMNNYFCSMVFCENSYNITVYNVSLVNNTIIFSKHLGQTLGGNLQFLNIEEILLNFLLICECYSEDGKSTGISALNIDFLYINNCFFSKNIGNYSNNVVNYNFGVALYFFDDNLKSYLKIERSLFIKNQIIFQNEKFLKGAPCAAIFIKKGSLEIKESFFEDNLSNDYCTCLTLTVSLIMINLSSFNRNKGNNSNDLKNPTLSGALVIDFYNLTIIRSNFTWNQAYQGSGILIPESIFQLQIFFAERMNFFGNYAFFSSNAIYIFSFECNRSFVFKQCLFILGKSDGFSGIFFFGTINGLILQKYSFYECYFLKNYGDDFAAIIQHFPPDPNNSFLYFELCEFIDNELTGENLFLRESIIFDIWGEGLGNLEEENYAIHTKNCIFSGDFFF